MDNRVAYLNHRIRVLEAEKESLANDLEKEQEKNSRMLFHFAFYVLLIGIMFVVGVFAHG